MGRNEGRLDTHLGLPSEVEQAFPTATAGTGKRGGWLRYRIARRCVGKLSNCLPALEGSREANGAARMASLAWRGMGRYGGRLQVAGAGAGAGRDTAARSRVPEAHAGLRSAHSRAMLAAAARGRSGVSARPPCGASGRTPGFEVSGAPRRRLSGARRRAEAARRAGEPGWDVARVPQSWA